MVALFNATVSFLVLFVFYVFVHGLPPLTVLLLALCVDSIDSADVRSGLVCFIGGDFSPRHSPFDGRVDDDDDVFESYILSRRCRSRNLSRPHSSESPYSRA